MDFLVAQQKKFAKIDDNKIKQTNLVKNQDFIMNGPNI